MKEERLVDGYYQSNIKTSRNEDSVYAMKYASQQILIDKLEEENKSLQSQLKAKEEVIKEAREYVEEYDVFKEFYFPLMKRDVENQIKSSIKYEFDTSIKKNLLEILSKGENK